MERFQPGEEVYVRLAFQSVVPIKDGHLVFVHEEDEDDEAAGSWEIPGGLPLGTCVPSLRNLG